MRPTQSAQTLRSNLFTDPNDLYVLHPEIGEMIDAAAFDLKEAHEYTTAADIGECLLRAEGNTLRANAAYASLLGPGADSGKLLALVRLAVEAIAHRPPASEAEKSRRQEVREHHSPGT